MASTPVLNSPHLHSGRRLRKMLRPDGKRIHIAASPEEQERLRKTLPSIEPDGEFDIYIHGSDEHLQVVREIHGHHEQRRRELQEMHGTIYDDFESVHTQLNALSAELNALTEHGVALDANFSKYGYDAHLRTRNADSSANSMITSSHDPEKRDWTAERQNGKALKFWRKPVVRQYFHKGLLWRASDTEEVGSYELFVDLLYVGIIAIVGDSAAEHPGGSALLKFIITFTIGWKMWADLTVVISWFEADDIFQRLWVMFEMICLFGYTLNIVYAFETTWTQLIAFYYPISIFASLKAFEVLRFSSSEVDANVEQLAHRVFAALYYLWISYMLPIVRAYMIFNTVLVIIPSALWIASIHVEYPRRLGLIWTALLFDICGSLLVVLLFRNTKKYPPKIATVIDRWFEFFPAVNIEHKTERTNAFVTLVFGYSVVVILYQNKAEYGINAFFGKAVLGLIQAFCFNWMYFEIDAFNIHTHAIRRAILSSTVWINVHLPFIMSYVLAGASLSKLVLAHDHHDTDLETLGELYLNRSEAHILDALRWFYCVGLGIALLCMTLISMSHLHKEIPGQRIAKRHRLVVRAAIAIILFCLPLAHELNSLKLVATTTGLVALALAVDLYGSTSGNDSFWHDKSVCKYSADCSAKKQDIETALKNGEKIQVEELAKGESGEKCCFE